MSITRFSLCIAVFLSIAQVSRAEFALRDGDTVVFLGDSITASRAYGKIIENYTLLRFPERKIRFVNSGRGGDTAAGGLARLEQDVFKHGATVLTVAYGVNDIGWGLRASAENKKKYLDSIRGIVEACKKRGVRVYICSAAVTGGDPNKSEESDLQKMCDDGMAIAKELKAESIDVQRSMRDVYKKVWASNEAEKKRYEKEQNDDKKPGKKGKKKGPAIVSLHTDGIHLSELGNLAMAVAILKGLGAPADVSSAAIDANDAKTLGSTGCKVSNVKTVGENLEFDRLDDGLPINFGSFTTLNFRFIPIPDELNRYMLKVANLKKGRYDVVADGRLVGTFASEQLAKGINISSATTDVWHPGGPWFAQSTVLAQMTDARHNLAVAKGLTGYYLPKNPNQKTVIAQNEQLNKQIEEMQRTLVKPTKYHFVIRPEVKKPDKKKGK